jgi:DNA-directed RNA polymerase specialized sigma24 family protein
LIDRYRRRRVRRAALERLRSDHSSRNLEDSSRDVPSRDEDLVVAQRVLQSLSTRERELALLRMRGARWTDIARVLGVREEAARQRWTALRRRVQKELRDEAFGPQMPRDIERTCTDQ